MNEVNGFSNQGKYNEQIVIQEKQGEWSWGECGDRNGMNMGMNSIFGLQEEWTKQSGVNGA